ncbi:MAG: carbohydrate binding domain-containing protein [Planctomycetota bacterium]
MTDPTREPENELSGRRPFGLEDVVTSRTSFAFFAFIYFVSAFTWVVGNTGHPLLRAIGAWIGIVGIWLSIRNMRPEVGFAKLIFAVVIFVQLALLFEESPAPQVFFRLCKAMAYLSLAGGFLTGLLGITRLLAPPKGMLLFLTLTLALAAVDAGIFWLESSRYPGKPTQTISPSPIEEVLIPPNDVAWIGTSAIPDSELEHRYIPDSQFLTGYPSNPRQYFHEVPIYGLLEPRRWRLGHSNLGKGRLRCIGSEPTVLRVEPREIGDGKPWNVMLQYGHLPITQGRRYAISFRARADVPRTIDFLMMSEGASPRNHGIYVKVPLTTEWTTVTRSFRATHSDPKSMFVFNLGEHVAPVELQNLSFERLSTNRPGPLDMRFWEITTTGGDEAELEVPTARNGVAKVRVLKSSSDDPWKVQVFQNSYQIWARKKYNYSLRVRIEQPRSLQMLITQSFPDWTNAGLAAEWSLKPGWNYIGGEFKARIDDPEARFVFGVGGSAVPLEFADIRLWSMEQTDDPEEEPVRHAVTYRINDMGFRDANHSPEPAPDSFRIACLGDSVTFGQGVHEEDTFTRRLEAILNARVPGQKFETMNFGVCGYSTWQERKCYELIASKTKPHLVLLTMVHNDNMSYLEAEERGLHEKPRAGDGLLGSIEKQVRSASASKDYQVCVDEVLKLKALCEQNGVRLLVVLYRDSNNPNWREMDETVTNGLASSGIPILNLKDKLASIPFDAISVLGVIDGHPNDVSHGIAATEIARFLEEQKLIPSPSPK